MLGVDYLLETSVPASIGFPSIGHTLSATAQERQNVWPHAMLMTGKLNKKNKTVEIYNYIKVSISYISILLQKPTPPTDTHIEQCKRSNGDKTPCILLYFIILKSNNQGPYLMF